jgi:hypothetical protein
MIGTYNHMQRTLIILGLPIVFKPNFALTKMAMFIARWVSYSHSNSGGKPAGKSDFTQSKQTAPSPDQKVD